MIDIEAEIEEIGTTTHDEWYGNLRNSAPTLDEWYDHVVTPKSNEWISHFTAPKNDDIENETRRGIMDGSIPSAVVHLPQPKTIQATPKSSPTASTSDKLPSELARLKTGECACKQRTVCLQPRKQRCTPSIKV